MKIYKEITFDAAHKLPNHPGKCKNLHGHTYKIRVGLHGEIDQAGMVFDFGRLKEILENEIAEKLDHQYLNDFMKNPTAEVTAFYIMQLLLKKDEIKNLLDSIEVWETPTSSVKLECNKIDNSREIFIL